MKKIVITGSEGAIGRVLCKGLKDKYDILRLDMSRGDDIRDIEELKNKLKGMDAIIHLAWDTKTENFNSGRVSPDNILMYQNVLEAAKAMQIRRVILASSVHVQDYMTWNKRKRGLIDINSPFEPISPYGANKVLLETLAKCFSKEGVEVICIRFGGVPPKKILRRRVEITGLAFPDCINAVRASLEAKKVPKNFVAFYAVSNNRKKVHDTVNPFGWKPEFDAEKYYSD